MYACTVGSIVLFGKIEKAVRKKVVVIIVLIDCGIATADGMHRCCFAIISILLYSI